MSALAQKFIAALQTKLPNMQVIDGKNAPETSKLGRADKPVVAISYPILGSFKISVYGADIETHTREVFKAIEGGVYLDDPDIPTTARLIFRRAEPMLDGNDVRIGECMHFAIRLHSQIHSA
jgi:hypothetical protein